MEKKYAPIVLFVFNRLDHAQKAVTALQKNAYAANSELYIYSDGARNAGEADSVTRVREYCRSITGFARVELIEREENWGIEKNEISALREVLSRYEACVVLEDDLEVGSRFLEYMNLALERYRDEKKVIAISGFSYIEAPARLTKGQQFYFSQMNPPWGWGTWADRWALFDEEHLNLDVLKTEAEQRRFDLDGARGFYQMLTEQVKNNYVTWDVAWYLKAFELGLLTLTPVHSLVNNIGMDGSGIHYNNKEMNNNRDRDLEQIREFRFPDEVRLDVAMRELERKSIVRQQRTERRKYRIYKVRSLLRRGIGKVRKGQLGDKR